MRRRSKNAPLTIKDLTSQAEWAVELSGEDHAWLESIARLEPEQFLLTDHPPHRLTMDKPVLEPILDRDLQGWRTGRYIGEIHHQGRTLHIKPRLEIDTIAEWL